MHRIYILVLICVAFCVTLAKAHSSTLSPLQEAQILAIDVSGELLPPQELTQQILNDLAAIRKAYPIIADINYLPHYRPDELMVGISKDAAEQFKAGQYHGLDELNKQYGVIAIDANHIYHGSLNILVLKFDKIYNAELLSDIYEQANPEGLVYAEPDYVAGDSDTIHAEPPDYTFIEGWGDCPAGCINHRYWHFRVENGQVTLLQITGPDGPELLVPTQYATIQSAIDAANENDTIIVQPGTYYENINLKGKAIRLTSSDGPKVTIIDGNGTGPVVRCVSGEGPNTVLDSFTITGGKANSGSGMYNENSSPTIVNCIFRNNDANSNGGAMFNKNSRPLLTNCILWENNADNGGGIYDDNSSSAIGNCTFSQNSASGNGGELYASNGSNTITTNCIFREVYEPLIDDTPFEHGVRFIMINFPGPMIRASEDANITVAHSDVWGWSFYNFEGTIAADPCFADASAGNFRLRPDSPCIDAGDNNIISIGQTDLNRKARIFGTAVDMGALEYMPNLPPMACITRGDRTIEATGKNTKVLLDGSRSIDNDSMAGTNDDINSFEWFLRDPNAVTPSGEGPIFLPLPSSSYDPNDDIPIGSGEVIECNLPIGVYGVVLKVTDKAKQTSSIAVRITIKDAAPPVITLNGDETITINQKNKYYKERGATAFDKYGGKVRVVIGGDKVNTKQCGTYIVTYDAVDSSGNAAKQVRRTITVEDTKPPYFRLSIKPRILRPADHNMVQVTPKWTLRDNCDKSPEVKLSSILATENGVVVGDLNASMDIAVDTDRTIFLLADSSQKNIRRIYTITYTAADEWGNITTRQAKCIVPRHKD